MAKEFDWNKAATMHSPEMIVFLKEVYQTPISEEHFVNRYQTMPMPAGKSKRGRRSPSYARQQYRNLRDEFGFFK